MLSSQIRVLLSMHSPVVYDRQDLVLMHPDGGQYQIYTHANLSATQANYPPVVVYFDLVLKMVTIQEFAAFKLEFGLDPDLSPHDYFKDKQLQVQPVLPGLVFKHHKGDRYELLCLNDGDPRFTYAVYRNLATQEIYARDFETFVNKFEPEFDVAKMG